MTMWRPARTILIAAFAVIAACSGARAGTLDLTVFNPNRTGQPGDVFMFQGTVTNNTADTEDQNSLFLNFSFDPELDPLELLSGQSFSLLPGETSSTMDLFQITLSPFAAMPAVYFADAFLQDSGRGFSDVSTVSISAAPEPGTTGLLMGGALLLWIGRRRTKLGGKRNE